MYTILEWNLIKTNNKITTKYILKLANTRPQILHGQSISKPRCLFDLILINKSLRYKRSIQTCIAKMVRTTTLSPTSLCRVTTPSLFGSLNARALLWIAYSMYWDLHQCFAWWCHWRSTWRACSACKDRGSRSQSDYLYWCLLFICCKLLWRPYRRSIHGYRRGCSLRRPLS